MTKEAPVEATSIGELMARTITPDAKSGKSGARAAGVPGVRHAWAFYFAFRPWIVAGMALYLVVLHLTAAGLVWHSSIPARVAFDLGFGSRWLEYTKGYEQKARILRRLASNVDPGAVFFVGDSILQSLDISSVADRAAQFSIGGDTLRRVANRLSDYQSSITARLVFLHVGINDLDFRPPERLERPMTTALHKIARRVPVVVDAIFPIDEQVYKETTNAAIHRANAVLREACARRASCTFIDSSAGLADRSGNLDPRYSVGDGLHLNGDGLRLWKHNLQPVLARWVQEPPPAGPQQEITRVEAGSQF